MIAYAFGLKPLLSSFSTKTYKYKYVIARVFRGEKCPILWTLVFYEDLILPMSFSNFKKV
jgi:hypothetical protein